jgi:hypothetical protein
MPLGQAAPARIVCRVVGDHCFAGAQGGAEQVIEVAER